MRRQKRFLPAIAFAFFVLVLLLELRYLKRKDRRATSPSLGIMHRVPGSSPDIPSPSTGVNHNAVLQSDDTAAMVMDKSPMAQWMSRDRVTVLQEVHRLRAEVQSLRQQLLDAPTTTTTSNVGSGGRRNNDAIQQSAKAEEKGGEGKDEVDAGKGRLKPSASLPPPSSQQPTSAAGGRASTASATPQLWLTIGIPTVPRRDESTEALPRTLLYQTVVSYLHQLAALEGVAPRVRVVVCNNRPGAHPVFHAVKRAVLQLHGDAFFGSAAQQFHFVDDDAPGAGSNGRVIYRDEVKPDDVPSDGHELPTPAVRRQSLDVVRLLDFVIMQPSDYFLFTEDDFTLCPNGLLALQYALGKTRWYAEHGAGERPFSALRCGFGLNGVVLHNSRRYGDVQRFRDYLFKHYARRPPDHLIVEFFAKETEEGRAHFGTRRPAAFRHNIFRHRGGSKSTLRDETAWSMPGCFTELVVPQLFEVEAWDPKACKGDDVWPCDSPAAEKHVVLRWNVSRETEVSSHWVQSPNE